MANITKDFIIKYTFIEPPSSLVPASVFADQACLFYRQLMHFTLRGGSPLMPMKPSTPPAYPALHKYQMVVAGYYKWLTIVVAQFFLGD